MSNLVHNERVKLYANFCNNLAVASLLGAFFAPAISHLSQTHNFTHELLYVLVGVVLTFVFHLYARWTLRELKD
jgi:uncharacterized membrane protein YgaE (UPF0421/DUF939 family)